MTMSAETPPFLLPDPSDEDARIDMNMAGVEKKIEPPMKAVDQKINLTDNLHKDVKPGVVELLSKFDDNHMLSKSALAADLKKSPRTVQRMVNCQHLPPPILMGVEKYWFVGAIRQWLNHRANMLMEKALPDAKKIWAYEK